MLVNRFYHLLEEEDKDIRQEALAIALLCMNDDYAIQVFGDYFRRDNLVRRARPAFPAAPSPAAGGGPVSVPADRRRERDLQACLRPIFADASKGDIAEELRNVLLDRLGNQLGKAIKLAPAARREGMNRTAGCWSRPSMSSSSSAKTRRSLPCSSATS